MSRPIHPRCLSCGRIVCEYSRQVGGAAPHRPVSGGKVDVVDALEAAHLGEHGVARLDQSGHLSARHRTAHERGRDFEARIVRELHDLPQHRPRLGNGACSETFEHIIAEPFEARLLLEGFEGRKRKPIRTLWEVGSECRARRGGAAIDPDHPSHQFGMAIHHQAHRRVRPAVRRDHDGLALGCGDPLDRGCLVVERAGRAARVCRVKTGKRQRCSTTTPSGQVFQHLIPRPGAQPVAGDQEDVRIIRVLRHASMLAATQDNGMAPFLT